MMTREKESPSIVLVVHTGFAARYLLRTEIYPTLLRLGARVFILTPNAEEAYFRQEFSNTQTTILPLNIQECERVMRARRGHSLFAKLHLYGSALPNHLIDRRLDRSTRGEGIRHPITGLLMRALVRLTRASALARRLWLALDYAVNPLTLHDSIFLKCKPDALVTVSPGYEAWLTDALFIREAQRHKVKTIAAIFGWDNPSTKGIPAAIPDTVLVWSGVMKREIETALDLVPARIHISGPAIFDVYSKEQWASRAELVKKYSLDSNKRIIFFATMSPNGFPYNSMYVRQLACAIQQGEICQACQLIVRLHPIYFRKDISPRLQQELEQYRALERDFLFIRYSLPEICSEKLSLDMPREEMRDVATLVKHCDVAVSFFSTILLESAVCDTPSVTINYDLPEHAAGTVRPSEFALHVHNSRAAMSGAGRVAQSLEELVRWVNFYLADPTQDGEERRDFARQECGSLDGHAGERAGTHIFDLVKK